MRVSSPVPKKRARIEIIPLIDIMFFLLASFMMVSLSQTHMKGIRVNLPAAVAPPPSPVKDYVSIKIREGNVVTFDNQIVTDDQVLPRLYELHRGNPEIKVSLSADLMAMHGDVIAVLDKVRCSGPRCSAPRCSTASAGTPTETLDFAAQRRQFSLQFANRLCPVTDIIFQLFGQFGESFFEPIWNKDRIVSESV